MLKRILYVKLITTNIMFINTIEEFVKYIPTTYGYNPDTEHSSYDVIRPFLEEVEIWLKSELIGPDLFEYIESSSDDELRDSVSRVIACNAYYSCIPFVDLIQTPNGFGIVQNATTAPASRDRVERLLSWVKTRFSQSVDTLITIIFTSTECNKLWMKSPNYSRYTECLIMTAASLQRYGRKDANRETLDDLHPLLMSYQANIAKMISSEYMAELIEKRRNQSLTNEDTAIIKSLLVVLGLMLKKEDIYSMLEEIVNAMVNNLDKYPTYKNSDAYQLKTSEKFRNKKNSSIFKW